MILFRLCELTGLPHPDYLAPFLTSSQLMDWQTYERQYGYRADLQLGLLLAAVRAQWASEPVKAADCFPYQDTEELEQEQLLQDMLARFPGLRAK